MYEDLNTSNFCPHVYEQLISTLKPLLTPQATYVQGSVNVPSLLFRLSKELSPQTTCFVSTVCQNRSTKTLQRFRTHYTRHCCCRFCGGVHFFLFYCKMIREGRNREAWRERERERETKESLWTNLKLVLPLSSPLFRSLQALFVGV